MPRRWRCLLRAAGRVRGELLAFRERREAWVRHDDWMEEGLNELALETFDIEARALIGLKARQGESFVQAVRAMLDSRGRVVVMGMGKSGHVGRKIAATLASTGTPAMFVHPAEASHGDLGMVTAGDVVMAISNSGESDEIAAILPGTSGARPMDPLSIVTLLRKSQFFGRLDDATKPVPVLCPETRKVRFIDAPKAYRLPFEVRVTCGARTTVEETVLVVHKRGLDRVERADEDFAPLEA